MRLSHERIEKLRVLLKEHYGLDLTDEELQQAGMAIIRFVVVKQSRQTQRRPAAQRRTAT